MSSDIQHESSNEIRSAAPLADSPWFWAALFAAMALVALVAVSGKYGRRQANIEQKYQARERVRWEDEERQMFDVRRQKEETSLDYSQPGNTVIPIWPLAVPLAAVLVVSTAMLVRKRKSNLIRCGEE